MTIINVMVKDYHHAVRAYLSGDSAVNELTICRKLGSLECKIAARCSYFHGVL